MSFLTLQKNEIIKQQYKTSCCKRSLLFGVLFARGYESSGHICVKVDSQENAEFIGELIHELFGVPHDIETLRSGGRGRIISFKSNSAYRYFTSLENSSDPYVSKCNMCRMHFLRGVFLACAKMSDPTKQYRLEFSLINNTELLGKILSELDINLSVTYRQNKPLLYTNRSSVIEDFLAVAGLNSTAFILMNEKIKSEFKNSVNRITNCETRNINKSVDASSRHRAAIEELERANLLSSLPEELEHTARMRMKYGEYSLTRLAGAFSPPLTKSGLSHRLNRIVEIANELTKKK